MKAVLLAAGKGERMKPVTDRIPKALVKLNGKSMLEWNLERVKEIGVGSLAIVVGDKKEQIMDAIGLEWNGITVTFVEQREQKGNGHALLQAASFTGNGNFWMLSCDDIVPVPYLHRLREKVEEEGFSAAMVGEEITEGIEKFGLMEIEGGKVTGIQEKPLPAPPRGIVNRSTYYFTPFIFDALKKITPDPRNGEYLLTDALKILIREGKGIAFVRGEGIIDIVSPEDVPAAEQRIKN